MIAEQDEPTAWAVALAVGFPLLVILLGEIRHALRSRKRIAVTITLLRNAVLPLLVLILLERLVLRLPSESLIRRLSETAFWLSLVYTSLLLLNECLFSTAAPESWRGRVPRMFQDLMRVFLVLCAGAIVLSQVWNWDLAGLVTALGIGSIVIGLALQETLGSIALGITILFERPFRVGDWIRVGEVCGEVIEMNWRSVRLLTRERELIIVPHQAIAGAVVHNYSQPEADYALEIMLSFEFEYPPNEVKRILLSAAYATPGVLHDPTPEIHTTEFGDKGVAYEVELRIASFAKRRLVRDRFLTLLWYTARRSGLGLPYPTESLRLIRDPVARERQRQQELLETVGGLPFASSSIHKGEKGQELRSGVGLQDYAAGEFVLVAGDEIQVLYQILAGEASLLVPAAEGGYTEVLKLGRGDFFGELSLFSSEPSAISVQAIGDLQVLTIPAEFVQKMIDEKPMFAREVGHIMEARRKAIELARAPTLLSTDSETS